MPDIKEKLRSTLPQEQISLSQVLTLEDQAVTTTEDMRDDIYIAIKEDEVPDAVLKAVLWGLAEEQDSLKKLRQRKEKEDQT
jgi:hypothetical protein